MRMSGLWRRGKKERKKEREREKKKDEIKKRGNKLLGEILDPRTPEELRKMSHMAGAPTRKIFFVLWRSGLLFMSLITLV